MNKRKKINKNRENSLNFDYLCSLFKDKRSFWMPIIMYLINRKNYE